jgi:hypothetical protein
MGLAVLERWWMLGAGVALAAWGAVGFYQGLGRAYSEGLYDPEYRVPGVLPGGTAHRAGFKAGDRIVSVDGRPVEELGMESRWPRSLRRQPGQTLRFVVERNGARVPLDVVYRTPPPRVIRSRSAFALTGLAFLLTGLWPLFTAGGAAASTLAGAGLAAAAGFAFGLGPGLGAWGGVQGHLSTAATTLLFLLLLRFFLIYPRAKSLSRSRAAAWIVWGAWGALLVFLGVELAVHPKLYYATGAAAGPLTAAYALLALAALVHTVVSGSRAELRACGVYGIVAGLVAAIGLVWAAAVFWPDLPGWGYAACAALFPLSMALAVRKHSRSAPETRLQAS